MKAKSILCTIMCVALFLTNAGIAQNTDKVFSDRSTPASFTSSIGAGEAVVYTSQNVDMLPQALNYDMITEHMGYPEVAKRSGIEGKVTLRVLVDENGEYVHHSIVADDHPLLRIPCELFTPYLKFEPAVVNGRKVKCWINVPFEFSLGENR